MRGRFLRIDWHWDTSQEFLTSAFGPRPPFQVLRILPGPQADWFPANALAGSDDNRPLFRVTPASNRMGLRIQGPPLPWPARELVSEAVCPGSVQVTRDGQCIILGVDGQTIGGYPKVAQVIAADLDRLGQLRPGESICFVPVTLADAETLYQRKRREIHEWLLRLRLADAGIVSASRPIG
jgi:antagonist of KipI